MGYLRFSLCIAVLYQHFMHSGTAGHVAVYGFFILSGFLTARVTTEIYNNGYTSKLYFIANRAVRLYPMYFICLLFSIACTFFAPAIASTLWYIIHIPNTPIDWLKQFTIVGLSRFKKINNPILMPPAFSLSTEIVYYWVIGILLAGRRKTVTMLFGLAALLTAIAQYNGTPFQIMYYSIQGPAVVFLLGATCYYWEGHIKKYCLHNQWALIALLNTLLYIPEFWHGNVINRWLVIYSSLPLLAWIIVSLHNQPEKPSALEQWCADLTYPIFLIQFSVGILIAYFLPWTHQWTLSFLLLDAFFCIMLSIILVMAIERPMKKYRELIRKKAQRL